MIDKHEKFKILLNESGEIILEIEGKRHFLSKTCAVAMKYELFDIIGLKQQWDDIHSWKPEHVEENF